MIFTKEQSPIVEDLIEEHRMRQLLPRERIDFETEIPEAESKLKDLENFPHFFVLACIMDRQMNAGKAWAIPYHVGTEIGGFEFARFNKLTLDQVRGVFTRRKLHRFYNMMAKYFYFAIQDIHSKYQDNASQIWLDKPKSTLVISRLREFGGVGLKISNMAANILVRDFKVPMEELSAIDIAPDVQVKRFFVYHGFLKKGASNDELIRLGREICTKYHLEYPGVLDYGAWEGGRKLKTNSKA